MNKTIRWIVAMLAILTLGLTACTAPTDSAEGDGPAVPRGEPEVQPEDTEGEPAGDEEPEDEFPGWAAFGEKIIYPDGIEAEVTKATSRELTAEEAQDGKDYYDADVEAGDILWTLTLRVKNGSDTMLDAYDSAYLAYGDDGLEADGWPSDDESTLDGKIPPGKAKSSVRAWVLPQDFSGESMLEAAFDFEHEPALFLGELTEF